MLKLLVIFILLESIWLFSMKGFYKTIFKAVSSDRKLSIKSYSAVLLSYILLLIGAYFFVKSFKTGLIYGAVIYGVYNLTNMATLANYSWKMVFIDTLWGTSLFAFLGFLFRVFYK